MTVMAERMSRVTGLREQKTEEDAVLLTRVLARTC